MAEHASASTIENGIAGPAGNKILMAILAVDAIVALVVAAICAWLYFHPSF